MSTVVLREARRRLMLFGCLGVIFVLFAAGTRDIAAQPKDDGFIFSSNSVSSALDHSQSLRLGERLTVAQLKQRLHSYQVERSHDCEGECIHVVGRNGVYLELSSGEPITGIMGFIGSRDILGHVIGMSLIKAIGSDKASCSDMVEGGAWCPSKLIKNIEYSVDDNACPDEDKFSFPPTLALASHIGCGTVGKLGQWLLMESDNYLLLQPNQT